MKEKKIRTDRWANRSEEDRLRCRATERRGGRLIQCVEDRRTPHKHQWRGKEFAGQDQPESRAEG